VLANYKSPRDFHTFVASGNEEALVKFYSSKRLAPLLGNNDFITRIREGRTSFFSGEHTRYETGALRPRVSSVLRDIATLYHVSEASLLQGKRGKRNEARQVAMYLVRELCNKSLHTIAEVFSLGSYGGAGAACSAKSSSRWTGAFDAGSNKSERWHAKELFKKRLDSFK